MFKALLFSMCIILQAYALNPKPYSELGDRLYNSIDSYATIPSYLPNLKLTLADYIQMVKQLKVHGFEAEAGKREAAGYLNALREADALRRRILVTLNAALYQSMEEDNTKQFLSIVKGGLLNLYKIQHDVLPYYKKRFKSGTLPQLDEMVVMEQKQLEAAQLRQQEQAQAIQDARVKRMRTADETEARALEERLDQEIEQERQKVQNMLEGEMVR